MNNFFRAIIAGLGARALGGGCLGTVVVFILIWVALGQCSNTFNQPKRIDKEEDKQKDESAEVAPRTERFISSYSEVSSVIAFHGLTHSSI